MSQSRQQRTVLVTLAREPHDWLRDEPAQVDMVLAVLEVRVKALYSGESQLGVA